MESKTNPALIVAAVFGGLGVALGAFGAHLLKSLLSPQALDWWHTAVEYHLVHAVVLVAVALLPASRVRTTVVWAFAIGIAFFSGSLYLLAVTGMTTFGLVTPLGGVAFLVGWISLVALGLSRRKP